MIKKIFRNKFFILLAVVILTSTTYADINFKKLENKKVSYFDFFLLKFENRLINRSQILRSQIGFATRIQYSHIGTQVKYDKEDKKILITLYAVMDKIRYSKKKYKQKLKDCNQIRNLIFYRKHGYKFFTQKRDPKLSTDIMIENFKESFFDNTDFNEKEVEFLLNNIFIDITIFHPVNKTKLSCGGKINDYELQ